MRKQYRCGICDAVFTDAWSLRGHIAAMMETNEKYEGDHPHWRDLPVSHEDLRAWEETVPGVTDY